MASRDRYLDWLLRRHCFPDFLAAMNNVVDLKEWSECVAMWHRIQPLLREEGGWKSAIVFDVGCGVRPTLATMVALNSPAVALGVDPKVSRHYGKDVERLSIWQGTLAELSTVAWRWWCEPTVVIASNHGHQSRGEVLEFAKYFVEAGREVWYVTCPCCVDNRLRGVPGTYYRDTESRSPKNEIYTWCLSDVMPKK